MRRPALPRAAQNPDPRGIYGLFGDGEDLQIEGGGALSATLVIGAFHQVV
jgi:hypothetical protein